MRTLLVPALALTMSVPSLALAQGQQSGGQQAGQGGGQQSQQMSTRSHKEVEDSLKQAGIQDVRTLNAAYLVSAVTKGGEQVTFVVDPPLSGGSSSSGSGGQQSGSSGQQSSGSQQGNSSSQQMHLRSQQEVRDSLTKAGFTNVQILDATYLATGKTKNGDQITMMIDPTAKTRSGGSSGSGGSGGSQASSGQSGSSSR